MLIISKMQKANCHANKPRGFADGCPYLWVQSGTKMQAVKFCARCTAFIWLCMEKPNAWWWMVLNHQNSGYLHRYVPVRVPVSVLQEDEMVWVCFLIILNYSCNKWESHPSFYENVVSTRIAVTTRLHKHTSHLG